ncbi:MAG TPA: hypothetical protein PLA74_11905 [Syntrophales bacterium]|nr:hypothetical protein [Syntrophales bacterium]HPQ45255.1 hypothetical protein [Syntrophales bacterium]
MSEDSTVITAWAALTTIGGALEAQYSSTRNPSNGNWSTPTKISGDFNKDALYIPLLATRNGTVAALWVAINTPVNNENSVFGAARDPGGVWQTGTQISAWEDSISIQDLDIWPTDGTIMALWDVEDYARAADEDEGLFWSARTPSNSWGSGGSGQLDTWYDSLKGSGMVMGADGTAAVIFGVNNTKKSATLPGEVRYVKWPSAGPWETPHVPIDSLATVSLNRATIASTTSGLPVSATWCAIKSVTDPLSTAIWQSQMGDNSIAAMPAVRSLLLH